MTTVSAAYVYDFKTKPDTNPWTDVGYTEKTTATRILSGSYRRVTGSPLTLYTGGEITGTTAKAHIEIVGGGAASDRARLAILDTSGNGYLAEFDVVQKVVTILGYTSFSSTGGIGTGTLPANFTAGDRVDFELIKGTPNTWSVRQNGNVVSLNASSQARTLGNLTCGLGIYYGNAGGVYIGSFGIDGLPQSTGSSIIDTSLAPATGRAYVTVDVPWPGGSLSVLSNCSPPAEDGDQLEYPTTTDQGATLTMRVDGTFTIASATGPQTFSVRVYDQTTADWSALWQVTVTTGVPEIVTTTLGTMTHGTAFSQTLDAAGTAPITWSVTTGTLPAGLALASTTGILSGTPTAPGAYSFTVTATNSSGSSSQAYTGSVLAVVPHITTSALPAAYVGSAYSSQLAATGSAPITWTLTGGTLPSGITLSSAGMLSGTPIAGGSHSPVFTATNSGGSDSATLPLTVSVVAVPSGSGTFLGGLPLTAAGQIYVSAGPVDHFYCGLPFAASGAVVGSTSGAITTWHNGIPRTTTGAIALDTVSAIALYHNGAPMTAGSKIAASTASVVRWANGLPFTATGRVSISDAPA